MQNNLTAAAADRTTTSPLMGLLQRAMSRGYAVVPCLSRDYVTTRAERTKKGRPEVELYEDGSGLEVAFIGYVFMLGVESKVGDAERGQH